MYANLHTYVILQEYFQRYAVSDVVMGENFRSDSTHPMHCVGHSNDRPESKMLCCCVMYETE